MKACYVSQTNQNRLEFVFDGRREAFARELDIIEPVINRHNLTEHRELIKDVEVILCTWGMETFTVDEIRFYFPSLKLVLYAAGSVQYFAKPFLETGVRIVSSSYAMARFVAEYTVATIYHANKGFYSAMRMYKEKGYRIAHDYSTMLMAGSYGTKVGLLGAGTIGRMVIGMLKNAAIDILVYDPFLPRNEAEQLCVIPTSLEQLFEECQTISNHLADKKEIEGILNYNLFRRMKKDATFINTGRGRQVVEADLARALQDEPGRFAVLDVTWPEPMADDHVFWTLPNIYITPHIAGYSRKEVWAFSDLLLEELSRYRNNEPLKYEVHLSMLPLLA
ncbi:MAG: NAD(P)-dependent oxidoreductase [Christensenellales bacterium]